LQLAVQMDVLEEYVKIEKLDPTQVPDAAVKHKEESFVKMSGELSAVESSGKQFIKDATDVSTARPPAVRRAQQNKISPCETICPPCQCSSRMLPSTVFLLYLGGLVVEVASFAA